MHQTQRPVPRSAANRLGLDYRQVPPRRLNVPIVDIHTHVYDLESAAVFMEVAELYGVRKVVSMSPVDAVEPLRERYGERLDFIAIPRWQDMKADEAFRARWMEDLTRFRELGARLCKFWMAPPMRERHGWTLQHEFVRPVIDHALAAGYQFMVHIADPSVWWKEGGKYADTARFGTKREQYDAYEWFLEHVSPRLVVGAHMGGSIEECDWLQTLLDRHENLVFDSSATKWIVREVAWQPQRVRELITRNPGRFLFGSDVVASSKYNDFDHYASRYWAHLHMWETSYEGESPIEDPDAPDPPRLAGVNLPDEVLRRFYVENAVAWGFVERPPVASAMR